MNSETLIEIKNASIYQGLNLVLSNVSLQIGKGEFVYLIGKTGSGKSSILKILYAELELQQGQVTIAGYDLKKLKKKDIPFLRRKIGIVFQDFQLLSDRNINDNLIFVLKATGWKDKDKIQQRIQEVLSLVQLGTKGFKFPHELSGGEQQRIAIARALLNNPAVILADEPTGNLDPETSEGIMKLLFDITEHGTSVVMATHDYSLFQKFPARTIRCESGKIIDSKVGIS